MAYRIGLSDLTRGGKREEFVTDHKWVVRCVRDGMLVVSWRIPSYLCKSSSREL